MALDDRSLGRLGGVHPDLVSVVMRAAEITDFRVTEGLRTLERQKMLLAQGRSQTLRSRHLTGHAVDLVDPGETWAEPAMKEIAAAMRDAAAELGVALEWGGTGVAGLARPTGWKTFEDSPHFQLSPRIYPETDHAAHAPSGAPAAAPSGAGSAARGDAAPVIEQVPGWSGVRAALAGSRTFLGAQLAALGGLVQYFDDAVAVLLDGLAEVARLSPLLAAGDVKSAGLGLTVFGVLLVLLRRAQAAYGGKPG